MTLEYYNKTANEFNNNTINIDMSDIHKSFCDFLTKGNRILDAGCGSGRDIIAFNKKGFNVDAFDLSPELVKIAKINSGMDVIVSSFLEYNSPNMYEAIWCCASLLHVPYDELTLTIRHLLKKLKVGGIFYMSFKYGNTERESDGRLFTDMNEERVIHIVQQLNYLTTIKIWITDDLRPNQTGKWINTILRKINND